MKIDGKKIADEIYEELLGRMQNLKNKGIDPSLAVILMGNDPGSVNYVAQKEKHAKNVGITLTIDTLPTTITEPELADIITSYNLDPTIHGIIIQRPTPKQITKKFLDSAVLPEKDVDGFHPESDFAAPLPLAIEKILFEIYKDLGGKSSLPSVSITHDTFAEWMLTQDIVLLGKGETAGLPIITHFQERKTLLTIIDSTTAHPEDILNEANIIITATGKKHVFPPTAILRDKIIIGVGLHLEDGKLRGDYTEDEVDGITSYYTPTPRGVGPVNVAMLLSNVVRAAEEQVEEV